MSRQIRRPNGLCKRLEPSLGLTFSVRGAALQTVRHVVESSCQVLIELLLSLPDIFRQFETPQLQTILDQCVSQDEECS